MRIYAGKLRYQFKTRHGFLAILSSSFDGWSDDFISIYYILEGFRGCDWGILLGEGEEPFSHKLKRAILGRQPEPAFPSKNLGEPLEGYRIESDRCLAFKVRESGWYRLTLYEDNPRRFLMSTWNYEPVGSTLMDRRYFAVRKVRDSEF